MHTHADQDWVENDATAEAEGSGKTATDCGENKGCEGSAFVFDVAFVEADLSFLLNLFSVLNRCNVNAKSKEIKHNSKSKDKPVHGATCLYVNNGRIILSASKQIDHEQSREQDHAHQVSGPIAEV